MSEEMPADQLLAKLFEVVLDEARTNRQFAERLVRSLPRQVIARIETKKRPPKPTEPPVSLTRLMNREGEDALVAFLKRRNKTQMRDIVERQQIPVDLAVLDGDVQGIRDAIVSGVKAKIADRLAAAS